jgi:FixJ family two-component response regulator
MPKSLHNILCQTQRSHGKRIYTPEKGRLNFLAHRAKAMEKMGASSLADLVRMAMTRA